MTTIGRSQAQPTIHIAAAVIRDDAGRMLVVRKRGTHAFMQPGGKIDVGETPREALARELHEELGLVVDPQAFSPLGEASAPAANEAGWTVHAVLFSAPLSGVVAPRAEIAEIRWISAGDAADIALAPLTREAVLPLL